MIKFFAARCTFHHSFFSARQGVRPPSGEKLFSREGGGGGLYYVVGVRVHVAESGSCILKRKALESRTELQLNIHRVHEVKRYYVPLYG